MFELLVLQIPSITNNVILFQGTEQLSLPRFSLIRTTYYKVEQNLDFDLLIDTGQASDNCTDDSMI